MGTICITMKFAKLFVRALLAVAFVQTGSALVRGEYEEAGQCEVLLVLVCKNIRKNQLCTFNITVKGQTRKWLVSMYFM